MMRDEVSNLIRPNEEVAEFNIQILLAACLLQEVSFYLYLINCMHEEAKYWITFTMRA